MLVCVFLQVRRGLDRGFKPELSLEGTGGTYFLQDAARQKVAVFKPSDEEPFAPNNPRCSCGLAPASFFVNRAYASFTAALPRTWHIFLQEAFFFSGPAYFHDSESSVQRLVTCKSVCA